MAKGQRTVGRDGEQGGEGTSGGGHVPSTHGSPQPAGVVIRATVEHIGLVGDTELTVNVKWPASIFCVPPCKKPATPSGPGSDSQDVPANGPDALIAEAVADPGPYQELKELKEKIANLPHNAGPAELKALVTGLKSGSEHTGPAPDPQTSEPYSEPTPKAEDKDRRKI